MASLRRTVAAAAVALASAATLSSAPVVSAATAAPAAPAAPAADAPASTSAYLPGSLDKAQNERLQAALDAAIARAGRDAASGARKPGPQAAAVVYYDDSRAPSFDSLIDQSASIWNARVANVKLVERDGAASLVYREGNSSYGSYYQGRGRGDGVIFMDYAQSDVYAPLRIVAHETGHALGLPDRYSQPCSKLMSGGGPGPSCTNPYPDSVEAGEVNTLWR